MPADRGVDENDTEVAPNDNQHLVPGTPGVEEATGDQETDREEASAWQQQEPALRVETAVSGGSRTTWTTPRRRRVSTPSSSTSSPQMAAVVPMGELISQLQRLCQRQRYRHDERSFSRDLEKIVAPLKLQHAPVGQPSVNDNHVTPSNSEGCHTGNAVEGRDSAGATAPSRARQTKRVLDWAEATVTHDREEENGPNRAEQSDGDDDHAGANATIAEFHVELLLDAMDELFVHHYADIRTLAFDVVHLCLTHYGTQFTSDIRRRIFELLDDHSPTTGDFAPRQQTLRALTLDGRYVQPFEIELGWLFLQWLEESDHQRDLLSLIQNVFRRSPHALHFETVVAITSTVCGRCDLAWTRGDVDTCRRYLSFFHALATHDLEHALGTSVCLRTLCCMVNADGHGTWSVMKHLLNGTAGFHVLRGLVLLLENPESQNQWILRGAVFFVGMSCWGSQRISKLDEVGWAPILLALEVCLECHHGVVIFEVILALQRLIKKFGDAKPSTSENVTETTLALPSSISSSVSSHSRDEHQLVADTATRHRTRRIEVEWDILLRMFRILRPWLSIHEDSDKVASHSSASSSIGRGESKSNKRQSEIAPHEAGANHREVPIYRTRIPRELLDTLLFVEDLVRDGKFGGDVDEFYKIMDLYLPYLPEHSMRMLLRHQAATANPAYHADWLQTLAHTMDVFFSDAIVMPVGVREEALDILHVNLASSRNVCEDRVIEDVLAPLLVDVYDDPHATIRRRGLDLVVEVARHLDSIRFDTLLEILENAVIVSGFEDSQQCAMAGIVSLFSSYFDHLPHSRAVRMYEFIMQVAGCHRQVNVRRTALTCLTHVCEASTDFRLQWCDSQVRTSRFLYCSSGVVRGTQVATSVPITMAVRSLLTLISSETQSSLFRMAVDGLRTMLKNRVILSDVDICDVALKIMLCVDYRAFGRAAIVDEVSQLMEELSPVSSADTTGKGSVDEEGKLSSLSGYDGSVADNCNAPRRILTNRSNTSNIRDVATMVCKTRFTTMGLELLALFISYTGELSDETCHHLLVCLIGALDAKLVLPSPLDQSMVLTHPDATLMSIEPSIRARSMSWSLAGAVPSVREVEDVEQVDQSSQTLPLPSYSTTEFPEVAVAEAKPVSPSHFPFTSRVFSHFHSNASHASIFNALSLSSSRTKSLIPPEVVAARAEEEARVNKCRQLLYDAEIQLVCTACNGVSLLALVLPSVVSARLNLLLANARGCYTTTHGDFRSDAYSAVLEMIGNVVNSNTQVQLLEHRKAIIEIILVAFQVPVSLATQYLAYRLLVELIFRASTNDRVELAALALPIFKECASLGSLSGVSSDEATSPLLEVAIDFLMCFAMSRSDLRSPAMRNSSAIGDRRPRGSSANSGFTTRSWVYHNAIVTIEMPEWGPAQMVVRRANVTTRWNISMNQDFFLEPSIVSPRDGQSDGDLGSLLSMKHDGGSPCTNGRESVGIGSQEHITENYRLGSSLANPIIADTEKADIRRHQQRRFAYRDTTTRELRLHTAKVAVTKSKKRVGFAKIGDDMHGAIPVPPLPAYDGIGGSPSYFCESAPIQFQSDGSGVSQLATLDTLTSEGMSTHSTMQYTRSCSNMHGKGTSVSSVLPGDTNSDYEADDDDVDVDVGPYDSLSSLQIQHESAPSVTNDTPSQHDETAKPAENAQQGVKNKWYDHKHVDPFHLMQEVFDLTTEYRPLLLTDGSALSLGLTVLDRTPEFETHKIGVLYVRGNKQKSEGSILGNFGGSLRYTQFLRRLGTLTRLQGLEGYAGGMDTIGDSDGKYTLVHRTHSLQMVFHVASMMVPDCTNDQASREANSLPAVPSSIKKKRHIGNDFVHVVFKECDDEYEVNTISGQFNDVHIIVQPLNDGEYRTQVHCKAGIARFGPLVGVQVIPAAIVADCVRQTCLNANLACQAFHQELLGFTLNCEERLRQIKQLGTRHATPVNDWVVDAMGVPASTSATT